MININILQPEYKYSPLRKALEKQTKKQVDSLKSLHFSKKNELTQIKSIFQQNMWNDLIIDKPKVSVIPVNIYIRKNISKYLSPIVCQKI